MRQKLAELIDSLRLQAKMFNDENNDFDVLVASDAIGMGLNLNISRIIFSTLRKFDGIEMRDLTVSEIKQIAGMLFRRYLYFISLRILSSARISSYYLCVIYIESRIFL